MILGEALGRHLALPTDLLVGCEVGTGTVEVSIAERHALDVLGVEHGFFEVLRRSDAPAPGLGGVHEERSLFRRDTRTYRLVAEGDALR
jgi:hypothetical protein